MQNAAISMDRMYRHQRHIYDITRKPYLLGRDSLIDSLMPPPGASVLEIGCGTARNLIHAARLYPGTQFYGIDVSTAMLEKARHCVDQAGLNDRITLAQADATRFCAQQVLGRPHFDRIFISYALSMIPAWQETLAHAFKLLTRNGSLHVVDFGDQAGLPVWFRKALHLWLAVFDVTPRNGLAQELAAETQARGFVLSHEMLYRGYAVHAIARA